MCQAVLIDPKVVTVNKKKTQLLALQTSPFKGQTSTLVELKDWFE